MVSILKNIGLPTSATLDQTSTVGEPSLACTRSKVFFSGNWYACESSDEGLQWRHVSPYHHLPPPASGGFCCDQTVIYVPQQNMVIWLLQYIRNNSENVLRVAVKNGDDDNNSWHWWDFTPTVVNSGWVNEWLDYNHVALSDNFFYFGTNVFNMTDEWSRSLVVRIPLDELVAAAGLSFEYFETTDNFSLRCAQGATSTMYFASHNSSREIRVFEWPESESEVTMHDVKVKRWAGVDRSTGGYSSVCPDGTDWLLRCDPRITAGWLSDGTLAFMWTVNKKGNRSNPSIRAVRINTNTMRRIDEPDIWNDNFAFAYPNACPNTNREIGVTMFLGGNTRYPSLVIGYFDTASNRWRLRFAQQGTHGPRDNKWGDYLTCRLHPNGTSWVAAGFTLQGGGGRKDIEPRYVHFEKEVTV